MSDDRARQFRCTTDGCGTTVATELPEGVIVNKPTFSMLMMTHQVATFCPKCGQGYVFVLRGIKGMEMGWMPVVVEQKENDVILPPTRLLDLSKLKGN